MPGMDISCPCCGKTNFLMMEQLDKETLGKIADVYGPDAELSGNRYAFAGFEQCDGCKRVYTATLSVIPLLND